MVDYSNQDFKSGDYIIREGEAPTCAYVLKSGRVEVVKSRTDGGEAILENLKPGDMFGEMAMVDMQPRSTSVRAVEDCTVIVVDSQTFTQKLENLDIFSRKLVQTLTTRLRNQSQKLADLSSPTSLLKAAKKGQLEPGKISHTSVLIRDDYRDKIDFGKIRLLMGDSNPQSRQGIKGGLHMQGFREIEDVNNAKDFRSLIASTDYDLIVVDSSLNVGDISDVINDIRHGKMSTSPFAVIFAIIEQPDPKTLEKLAEAGLDDVLVKPVALANIIDRVERRIKKRKDFVVTLDYVGPDRRSSARVGGEQIPLVAVPNPLSFKALELIDERTYASLSKEALSRIEDLKIERFAVQIDWLRGKIATQITENQNPKFFLERMFDVTQALIEKLDRRNDETHVTNCRLILSNLDDFEVGTADMKGEEWENFAALTRQLRTELGPKKTA
jgi:DNA-binding response OmpR family regulator